MIIVLYYILVFTSLNNLIIPSCQLPDYTTDPELNKYNFRNNLKNKIIY